MTLRAPFPWFGGKSRVAPLVWRAFGDTPNYVEPFAGSLAVLLARPTPPGTETVNDADCYLANFWRATQADPIAVASYAGWPVNEADLHARHRWLVGQTGFRERMRSEPDFYDPLIAGWWAWGISQWIGTGWCSHPEWEGRAVVTGSAAERGLHARGVRVRGDGAPPEQLPHLGSAGMGLHRKLPHLGDAGRGLHRKLPHLGDAGRGMLSWICELSDRLRHVRVACGDWTRILGPSVTEKHGVTAVLLDPPYDDARHDVSYAAGGGVSAAVREWAQANGANPLLRIALCGYAGEHDALEADGWSVVEWKAKGGYGSQGTGRGRDNAGRERVWFSPACLTARRIAGPLFAQQDADAV
jgi:DNA adenine methylase